MAPNKWGAADIKPQTGKVAIVTGSTSGVGYEVAYALAQAGAQVVLAVRNETKALSAIIKMKEDLPDARITFIQLDLTNLASIEEFSRDFGDQYFKLDILVNVASIMDVPERKVTVDGFEIQFGTNYLGHYALTNSMLQYFVRAVGHARVVSVSSRLARGTINFEDLMGEKKYKSSVAYYQSKLATIMFAIELQKQTETRGWGIVSVAVHPGKITKDDQSCKCLGCSGQNAYEGALPILFAATAEDVEPGAYYGPQSCNGTRGNIGLAKIPKAALNEGNRNKLWEVSSTLTNVDWPDNILAFKMEDDATTGTGDRMNEIDLL